MYKIYLDDFVGMTRGKTVDSGFSIYPNPASETIQIELNMDVSFSGYRILNSNGGMVLSGSLKDTGRAAGIDVSSLKRGPYILMLFNDNSSSSASFIKY